MISRLLDPRKWEMWNNPWPVITYQLACELVAIVALGFGFATSWPATSTEWVRFAAFAICVTLHIQLTRRQEERRRNRLLAVHIDLTGMWTFPAALLLPIQLFLALLLLVRVQRWINSRRPLHRFVFSSLTYAATALLAQRVFVELDPSRLTTLSDHNALQVFGILILVGLVYGLTDAAIVGGVLALGGTKQRTLANIFGSKTDNLIEVGTIGMGMVIAVLGVQLLPAIGIMILVGVMGNRLAEISQLQEEADTDSKTGLLNMRGWTEAAQRAFERAHRSSQEITLIMLDLDHFKWINDTYGHPAGDDVLKATAHLLRHVTRPTDVVGRFGGEEFVLLLPETDMYSAEHATNRVLEAISSLRVATTGKHGSEVTIANRTTSIGVAVYPVHGQTLDELLNAADTAVYEAKEAGRDQVRFARRKPRTAPPIELRP